MTPPATHRILGEIESPLPLRAPDGRVTITGWCLAAGQLQPPAVRLVCPAGTLSQTKRFARTDVPAREPHEPAAAQAGFGIEGELPEGAHLVRLEAQLADGAWIPFKSLSLAVESRRFAAAVEFPPGTAPIRERVHVEGWALHPRQAVRELHLRYGHQEIPCEPGRSRRDLPALHPGAPHAAEAGFKSRTILSAGRGPLRLKARLADGSVAVARTRLTIAVDEDENHTPGLVGDFAAAALPAATPRAAPPAAPAAHPLRILFILPGSFASNNALHVAGLANELSAHGHACVVAVSHDPDTLAHHVRPAFRGTTHAAASAGDALFPGGSGPDVIHAWTTRENVRRLATELQARHRCRLVVHLEDNEQQVLALSLGRSAPELAALPDAKLDALVPPDLSHPRRSRAFLAAADGVTLITERLAEFVPAGPARLTLTPAADARFFFPRPVPAEFRRALRLPDGAFVLFYHGNVHAANAAEMRELYGAVVRLNRDGQPTVLIRTGLDAVDFLGPLAREAAPHVLALGQILHHHHLPPLMALADAFVQPGAPDAFNDYRFPSKLPEFFALGRPVILPRTNLGLHVRHGVDAWVLDRADAAGIAGAVTTLRRDRAAYDRLATGATAFAEAHFSWRRSAEALATFYAGLSGSAAVQV